MRGRSVFRIRFGSLAIGQWVTAVIGAAYLALSAAGLSRIIARVRNADTDFASTEASVWVFELGALEALFLLGGGAILVVSMFAPRIARRVRVVLGAGALALGVWGLVDMGSSFVLPVDTPMSALYLLSGAILLGSGLGPLLYRRIPALYTEDFILRRRYERTKVPDELGVVRPGEAVPVSGAYVCELDGQEMSFNRGDTVPPCPQDVTRGGEVHRFRLEERANA